MHVLGRNPWFLSEPLLFCLWAKGVWLYATSHGTWKAHGSAASFGIHPTISLTSAICGTLSCKPSEMRGQAPSFGSVLVLCCSVHLVRYLGIRCTLLQHQNAMATLPAEDISRVFRKLKSQQANKVSCPASVPTSRWLSVHDYAMKCPGSEEGALQTRLIRTRFGDAGLL